MKVWNHSDNCAGVILYTIIDVEGDSVKATHPDIGGYFIFSAESVCEVIEEIDNEEG